MVEVRINEPVDLFGARLESISIEVTSKCNLRCAYCSKADPVHEASPDANADMTDEMIAELYRSCKAAGIRSVSLSGVGETTMMPGWHARISQFLDDPEIKTQLVSNFARLFDETDLEALLKLDVLQISFDTPHFALLRKLRSRVDVRTIAYNIVRLRQKGRALGRVPYLIVNCTLCRENVGHIVDLAQFCRELAIDELLITSMMGVTEQRPAPDGLGFCDDDEVILLAQQILLAQELLAESSTSLRLRQELEERIADVLDSLRDGKSFEHPAASFNRPRPLSACRQPWASPIVGALGKVSACCGIGDAIQVGDLSTQSFADVMNGEAIRRIRESILSGRPIIDCESCSFASPQSFPEFTHHLRRWLGASTAPYDSDVNSAVWPTLFGSENHPILVENASSFSADAHGAITLIEDQGFGQHRVLVDTAAVKISEIQIVARLIGRRLLRLDIHDGLDLLTRIHLHSLGRLRADVSVGALDYALKPGVDGWFEFRARLAEPLVVSHVNVSSIRGDGADRFSGDGRSGFAVASFHMS